MAARFDDPLSGEGARIHGGRFNPPDSFAVVYLCTTRACAVAELRHRGAGLTIGVEGLLPRVLYRYEVGLERVLDLTAKGTLHHLGITAYQVLGADVALPRSIGETARGAGFQGVRARSATRVDDVLAVFPEGTKGLAAHFEERWEMLADL
jgi:RES domain-containing protein